MNVSTMNKYDNSASDDRAVQYIRPSEFRALAVSHRRMVREDNAHSQTRGLRDLETGELFVVDERALRTGLQ